MHLGCAIKDFVELTLGGHALLGGLAGVMPRANAPQVGEAVIVTGFDVIYLSGSITTAGTVLFGHLTAPTTPL
jgi:hypothetical protein